MRKPREGRFEEGESYHFLSLLIYSVNNVIFYLAQF